MDTRQLPKPGGTAGAIADTEGQRSVASDYTRKDIKDAEAALFLQRLEAAQHDPWGRPFTLADAYKPRPPVQYIVNGLFKLPSLSIVYGAPGTLKSFLLADMCACISVGTGWLAPLLHDENAAIFTLQAPVLWLDFDNGKNRTDERFEALGRAYDLPPTAPLFYYVLPSPGLAMDHVHDAEALADRIRRIGARLVVIDNLATVKGSANENTDEMVPVTQNFRWVAETTGAALVLIHHQTKGSDRDSNRRAGDRLRGHSSIEAALDLALLVEREERSGVVTVKQTKTRGVDVEPFGAMFTYEHKAETDELKMARFFRFGVEDDASDAAIDRAILEVVRASHPINQTKLTTQVKPTIGDKVGVNRIRGRARHLAEKGKLRETTGASNAKLYDLPAGGVA